jgi:hypothetical protein
LVAKGEGAKAILVLTARERNLKGQARRPVPTPLKITKLTIICRILKQLSAVAPAFAKMRIAVEIHSNV